MFPKECRPIPKNWKKDFWMTLFTDNRTKPEKVKKVPKPLKQTPIKQIWKRKKEQLKKGSQTDVFSKIWIYREHICEYCKDPIPEPLSFCFAHRLWKWVYPEFIHEIRNISLVCSPECHHALDWVLAHHNKEIITFITKKQPSWFSVLLKKWEQEFQVKKIWLSDKK